MMQIWAIPREALYAGLGSRWDRRQYADGPLMG
jgi:hypothetical protein